MSIFSVSRRFVYEIKYKFNVKLVNIQYRPVFDSIIIISYQCKPQIILNIVEFNVNYLNVNLEI